MLLVLRQRNFALLTLGSLVSMTGDMVLVVALPYYVYERTGSASATGAMFIVGTMPVLLFGLVSGVFVDRWDRKLTLTRGTQLQGLTTLLLLITSATGWIWVVYVSSFVEKAVAQFTAPASAALLPRVVAEEDLITANSLLSTGRSIVLVLGPLMGSAVMALLGLPAVVLIDSISFILGALLFTSLVLPSEPLGGQEAPVSPVNSSPPGKLWSEWRDGLAFISRHRFLKIYLIVLAIASFAQGLIGALYVVFIREELGADALQFGWFISAQGLGGVIGGILASQMAKQIGVERMIALAVGVCAPLILIMANIRLLTVVLPIGALIGVAQVGWLIGQRTMLQKRVPDWVRGRIFGTITFAWALPSLGGLAFSSILADPIGVVPVFDVAGLLFLLAAVIAFAAPPSDVVESIVITRQPAHAAGSAKKGSGPNVAG